VLRVLGTMLGLPGFEFQSSDEVRDAVVAPGSDVSARLDNRTDVALSAPPRSAAAVERAADIPIYFTDALVRRAPSLQKTSDARPPRARVHPTMLDRLGIAGGAQIRIRQGSGEAVIAADGDASVPPGVVRLGAAHPSTCSLEGLSGPVSVERA
jgi:NADH-quinone oxidoreductase subunit G